MRVLFVHQNFPAQFKHLAPALAAQGHEVVALGVNRADPPPGVRLVLHRPRIPPPAQPPASADEAAFQELQAKYARGRSVARVLQKLKQEGFVPDLVYAHSGWGEAIHVKDVFPDARLLVYAEYYYRSSGGDANFDPEFPPAAGGVERLQVKNVHLAQALVQADRGVSPTRFQRDRHPEVLRRHIEVVHDGIDTATFVPSARAMIRLQRAGLALTPADEVITFVARELEPYRGYHSFMRALPELMARRPRAEVVVVGGNGTSYGAKPPPGSSWKEIFLREVASGIDRSRLHFVGKLPHALLTELMQVSTVHVYLTYPFVLSWSMLEAMSIGCLVVASRTAPVEEVIEHGRTGLLVDFFDPAAIAAQVADAAERRDELRPLREAARQHVVEHYDLQRVCLPRQLELLRRVAAAGG